MANLTNNLKAELVLALNNSDANKAANLLKTLHSQVCNIKISLSPAPYTSFSPSPIILQSSPFDSSPVQSPPSNSKFQPPSNSSSYNQYPSFTPNQKTFESSSIPLRSSISPPSTPKAQPKSMNPEIYNGLLHLGYPEALSLRVSSLTSSIGAAVDYIHSNNLF